jgi:hypothetical protein
MAAGSIFFPRFALRDYNPQVMPSKKWPRVSRHLARCTRGCLTRSIGPLGSFVDRSEWFARRSLSPLLLLGQGAEDRDEPHGLMHAMPRALPTVPLGRRQLTGTMLSIVPWPLRPLKGRP